MNNENILTLFTDILNNLNLSFRLTTFNPAQSGDTFPVIACYISEATGEEDETKDNITFRKAVSVNIEVWVTPGLYANREANNTIQTIKDGIFTNSTLVNTFDEMGYAERYATFVEGDAPYVVGVLTITGGITETYSF